MYSSAEDPNEPPSTPGERFSKETSLRLPQAPEADVAQDAAQPPVHRFGLAQPFDVAQGAEECGLDGVLGFGSAAEDAQRDSVERRLVALEQEPQTRNVAVLGRPD